MVKTRKFHAPAKRKLTLCIGALVLVGGLLFILEKTNVINLYSRDSKSSDDAKTTSTSPTAQEDFTEGNEREPGNSLNENEGTGTLTDNNGEIAPDTDLSSPLISSTGEITIYTPKKDASVSSGYTVSGTSTLSSVSYRLIDDLSGVIATGDLSVVNGKFSGSLSFNTNAQSGRLDIFATRVDGTEFSNIEIPLKFR